MDSVETDFAHNLEFQLAPPLVWLWWSVSCLNCDETKHIMVWVSFKSDYFCIYTKFTDIDQN